MPPKKKAGALPRGSGPKTINTNNNKGGLRVSQSPPTSGLRRSERIQKKRTLNAQTLNAPELLVLTQAPSHNRVDQNVKDSSRSPSQPNQNQDGKRSQLYSKLATWLEEVRIRAVEDLGASDSALSEAEESSMAARSVYSLTTRGSSAAPSTIVPRRPRAKKVTLEALRTRQVEVTEASEDERTTEFRRYLIEKRMKIPFKKTESLLKSMKNFERKAEIADDDDDSWDAIEELCKEINKWKATTRLATITSEDFKDDLTYCKLSSNEAVFQRTVMMSIIDRCHLKTVFNYNCEGQWNQETCPLPSTNGLGDVITDPKPDLAIFFRFGSLVGTDSFAKSAPIPPDLQPRMSPDGYTQRCFPFIFIEAKKATADIQPAALANFHSASQALFNIYAWMSRAKEDDIFFKDVRVFSIAINAEKAIVRVHRAEPVSNESDVGLEFLYNNLYPEEKEAYTRDEICALIRNILIDYAEKTLLGILKSTVNKVLKEHKQALKRKNDNVFLGPSSKRLAAAQPGSSSIEPLPMNMSASFGMSQVEIHDG